ncbi:TPA: hypothetical protein OC317_000282 [Escherichia coli]|nr:hypothetical protein [Escherichia albertii]EHZ9648107.1 hypothetical protein [Escherichia coli]EIA0747903.1 hypothetical protein [Escherichia coli]EII6421994.1 hypothetical protein [Escherichia coli]EIS6567688.1 hypothetical protein [Escherichia coli]
MPFVLEDQSKEGRLSSASKLDSYEKVPLISNVAAGGITGFLTLLVSSWDGRFPYIGSDLNTIKPFLLLMLPSCAMFLAHWIKSIGFKWSLGSVNRQLLSINKKKEKELRRDIEKYKNVISNEKIEDFKSQLEQVLQDRHDIISNNYAQKLRERNYTQEKYHEHKQTAANDNIELQSILENQKFNQKGID